MLGEKRMVQKRCFYEWSVRVPVVVALPDGRGAGTTVAEPMSLLDLLPTLLDLLGFPEHERVPLHGRSFAGLLDGDPGEARTVLSEYHVEKVRAPCFMARRGRHKYVLVHGYASQLFDLERDPGEWENLGGRPEVADVEAELREAILAQFDPDAIAADGAASVRRRELVRRALERNGTSWDYEPFFDASRQYVR
jgi:choline-sulfatase